MRIEVVEAGLLDSYDTILLSELIEFTGVAENELYEMVDHGILVPLNTDRMSLEFDASCIVTVQKAKQLLAQFELDLHDLALVMTLLNRIDDMEAELHELRTTR